MIIEINMDGGPGSGNRHHQGVQGQRGGSMGEDGIPKDSNGVPYQRKQLWLDKAEYAQVMSEINTFYSEYEDEPIAYHLTYDEHNEKYTIYKFENHGYNEYNIFAKEEY